MEAFPCACVLEPGNGSMHTEQLLHLTGAQQAGDRGQGWSITGEQH